MLTVKIKTKDSSTYLVPGPTTGGRKRHAIVKINQPDSFQRRGLRRRNLPLAQNKNRYYSIWLSYGTIDDAPDAERDALTLA
jgi:hypothetical protein